MEMTDQERIQRASEINPSELREVIKMDSEISEDNKTELFEILDFAIHEHYKRMIWKHPERLNYLPRFDHYFQLEELIQEEEVEDYENFVSLLLYWRDQAPLVESN